VQVLVVAVLGVSIRAPVMGAIACPATKRHGQEVSIRAPVMGAIQPTQEQPRWQTVSIRAPVMGAIEIVTAKAHPECVSIRAPVMGAISATAWYLAADPSFNPRPRDGGDLPSCLRVS